MNFYRKTTFFTKIPTGYFSTIGNIIPIIYHENPIFNISCRKIFTILVLLVICKKIFIFKGIYLTYHVRQIKTKGVIYSLNNGLSFSLFGFLRNCISSECKKPPWYWHNYSAHCSKQLFVQTKKDIYFLLNLYNAYI